MIGDKLKEIRENIHMNKKNLLRILAQNILLITDMKLEQGNQIQIF